MKPNFYGTYASAPTESTAEAFGVSGVPVRLMGGQGTTYQVGDIVLKPSESNELAIWMAEVFTNLPESPAVRFARPIKARTGQWMYDGYVAWSRLDGEHQQGGYVNKLSASKAFHELLKPIPKPEFVGLASSSWATADLVAWGKHAADYGPEFDVLIGLIMPHLEVVDITPQLIHGDLSGNFLVKDTMPPAIIDFSPAWAPTGFAEGIMMVDAIVWERASKETMLAFKQIPHIQQLAWRGALRRIAEQAEHMTWFNKDKQQALQEASVFRKAIDYLAEC